jgi:hypothetical protein
MRCYCDAGLKKWGATLRELATDKESIGAEKLISVGTHFLKFFSALEWLLFCASGDREDSGVSRRNTLIVDCFVFGQTLLVFVLVWMHQAYLCASSIVTAYLLFQMFVALFNVVFLARKVKGFPVSFERSLFFLILNAAQLIFSFAIFYQAFYLTDPWTALVYSFEVFGTVGSQKDYVPLVLPR